jgi:hypothetical protein
MGNNVFSVDNRFFKQSNNSTASMGTSCACSYASIYYSFPEETALLQPNIVPIFCYRLIDSDAYIIQHNTLQGYTSFMQAMNSVGQDGSQLEWESPGPRGAFNFLDLHIQFNPEGSLTMTSTFEKPRNVYLFQPPASARPPSILYGLIYGKLHWLF